MNEALLNGLRATDGHGWNSMKSSARHPNSRTTEGSLVAQESVTRLVDFNAEEYLKEILSAHFDVVEKSLELLKEGELMEVNNTLFGKYRTQWDAINNQEARLFIKLNEIREKKYPAIITYSGAKIITPTFLGYPEYSRKTLRPWELDRNHSK